MVHDMRDVAQGFDVVDRRWLAPQPGHGRERRLRTRVGPFPLKRVQHSGFFAAHVPSRADVQIHLEAVGGPQDVPAEISRRVSFRDRFGDSLRRQFVLAAKEHVRDIRTGRVGGDHHAFKQLMRIAFE